MLAAFGRGALGTLTDRFNQYDAAVESVARHEQTLDKHLQVLNSISEAKVEWFVIPITAAVYEDILSGVKDYITIPYDISTLIDGDSQLKSGQAGIKLEVADEASVNAVYLPFTLVSQAYILPSFDDLVIRGTSLSSGKAYDTRYHVNVDAETNYIKLEKVKESAGAAELPWLDVTPQSEEEFGKFVAAFIQEAGLNGKADYELNLNASTDLTQYRGIRIDLGEGNVVETPVVATVGNGFICAPAFLSDNEFVFGITKETGGKFTLHIYNLSSQYANVLSDYAKKTDIPAKPFTFVVDGDAAGLNIEQVADGTISTFTIQVPTAISSQLGKAVDAFVDAGKGASGTIVSVPLIDIASLMPRFTFIGERGYCVSRFEATGTDNDYIIYFRGTISCFGCSSDWKASYDSGHLDFTLIK